MSRLKLPFSPILSLYGRIEAQILEPKIKVSVYYSQSQSFVLIKLCPQRLPFTISSKCVCMCSCVLSCFSRVQLFAILWTVTCQVPLSMGFSRQGYWSVLPFPPPGDLPASEIKPASLMYPHWHVGSLPLVQPGKPIKPLYSRSHKSLGCSSLSMNVIYII